MDSFELNKIAGAILGTLTFTLGLSIVADIIFSQHPPAKPGFEIVVKEASSGEAQAAAPADVPIANLLAAASVERGAAQAKKCGACHNFVEGAGAKVGPDLYGVVGRAGRQRARLRLFRGDQGAWRHLDLPGPLGLHQEPEGRHPRHRDGLRRPAEGNRSRRPAGLSEHAVAQPAAAAAAGRRACGRSGRRTRGWREAGGSQAC